MAIDSSRESLARTLTYASAREQAQALAQGRVRAVELLEHSLARIDRYDGAINAVAVRDDARARQAALAADRLLADGVRKPLLGVPITVKESFDVQGLHTTSGNPAFADNLAERDAHAVAALRAAGAVILGKTNVPLALADLQSYNALHGICRNPWDLARTPGGSSGGSAAALAAGYTALELGSDIGGSIRIPAHFTGVFGHKSTYGLISMRGSSVPSGRVADRDLGVAGPLARNAADLELALDLLLNLEPLARKAWRVTLPPSRQQHLAGFRVLLLDQWPGAPRSLSEQLVVDRVARHLHAGGATVLWAADLPAGLLPDLQLAHRVYRTLIGSSLATPPRLSEAAQRMLEALAPSDESADAAWLRAPTLSHRDWLTNNELRYRMREQWERLFEAVDIVVTPVAPTPAFQHNHTEPKDQRTYPVAFEDGIRPVRFMDLFHWAGLPVMPGLPATSFPVGLDDDGLPVSAQAMGAYLEDRSTIAFAGLMEAAFGGFQVPPGYEP